MKNLLKLLNQKITKILAGINVKLVARIFKWAAITALLIAVIFIIDQISFDEIKSIFLYYYSEILVFEGRGEKIINISNHFGGIEHISAINFFTDPLVILLKHDFYWVIFKGFLVGYLFFKFLSLLILIYLYLKNKILPKIKN